MITTIKLFLVAWFITHFEPLTSFLADLFLKVRMRIKTSQTKRLLWDTFYEILTCHKCLSLWLVFSFTLNPFYALGASFAAWILENKPFK